ncbi:unnamed protein product [Peniophora sp. CBMAI 1063]|nr:unnamed protein product [Peniophora sp. CBMAI 1063]
MKKRAHDPDSDATTSAPTSKRQKMDVDLHPLPPAELALALPSLLTRPPTHAQHPAGLSLSRAAVHNLLSAPSNLSTETQTRAWLQLAELSIQSLPLLAPSSDEEESTTAEIDRALSKVLALAPKNEYGRNMKTQATLLQVQMAAGRGQAKFALKLLGRLMSGFGEKDPPALVYAARLAKVQLHLSAPRPAPLTVEEDAPPRTPPADKDPALSELRAALDAIREMRALAGKSGEGQAHVALLCCVLRAGIVVTRGLWTEAESAVKDAEEALELTYLESPKPGALRRTSTGNTAASGSSAPSTTTANDKGKSKAKPETFVMFEDAFEATCAAHVLIYSVVYHTHIGDATGAAFRLNHLHALLDEGAMSAFPDGVVEIQLPTGPPLCVRTTPPRVLFALGYLAGLDNLDEKEGPALEFPLWASASDVEDAGYTMIRICADLLSKIAGLRSPRDLHSTSVQYTRVANVLSTTSSSPWRPKRGLAYLASSHLHARVVRVRNRMDDKQRGQESKRCSNADGLIIKSRLLF